MSDPTERRIAQDPVPEDTERIARAIVTALAGGDDATLVGSFDATLRAVLPAERARAAWRSVEERSGAFEGIERVTSRRDHGHVVQFVRCRMARALVTVRVAFNPDGAVEGLFLVPDEAGAEWKPPAYTDVAAFDAIPVGIGSNPTLPGTLTMPRPTAGDAGPFAAVVLVHGSGPADRDESMGSTKVFRDLAYGMSSRRIAVLRYDKRTLVAREGVVTQKEEVIDGALAALATLRSAPGIDARRLVLLGHSQGGTLAPRIARLDGSLAGVIVLAGAVRPLEDAIVAQVAYLQSQQPTRPDLAELSARALAFRAAVQAQELRPDTVVPLPTGGTVTGAYFLDARGYRPEIVASSLPCPLFVAQGGRDYQVTVQDDFNGWRSALAKDPRATLKLYPSLDHRFVAGSGPSTPEQYADGGHVAPDVIEDLASWVRSLPPVRAP